MQVRILSGVLFNLMIMWHWLLHTESGQYALFWLLYLTILLGSFTGLMWWATPSEEQRLAERIALLEQIARENVDREPKRLL